MAQSLTFSSQSSITRWRPVWVECVLMHWNNIMLFQKIYNLITHKAFHHLCNMIYDRYWAIISFVINVAIILINRRHSGVLPVLLKDTRLKGLITFANDIEIYRDDSLYETRSMPNISLLDLFVRYPKYVLISSLDIFLKRKLWMLLGLSMIKIVIKTLIFLSSFCC